MLSRETSFAFPSLDRFYPKAHCLTMFSSDISTIAHNLEAALILVPLLVLAAWVAIYRIQNR